MAHYRRFIVEEKSQRLSSRSFRGWKSSLVFGPNFVNISSLHVQGSSVLAVSCPPNQTTRISLFKFNTEDARFTAIHGNFLVRVLPGYTDEVILRVQALLKELFKCSPQIYEVSDDTFKGKYLLIEFYES